jgi:glycosyltransferase involved in cell wall biosynthesis
MGAAPSRVALLYDDDAYVELLQPGKQSDPGAAMGLMGRQVAGKEFLDAYLTTGRWDELAAVVRNDASAASITDLWKTHPATRDGRRLRVVRQQAFLKEFFPTPPAPVLHVPYPPDARYAWARQHGGPGTFALSGLTHTICSQSVAQGICNLVTAPFEPYDVLVCISRAAVTMVRTLAATYAEHLRAMHGGNPGLRVRLEHIPLGVNIERYHPATPAERAASRRRLGVADDELVVLFVGRLSFHAKVHPYPIYDGVARAAQATGRKVHLILSGWAANQQIFKAFQEGAKVCAPGVRVNIVPGTHPDYRFAVWHAADVFTSLTDNIQETFSQVVIEAMASGLPVVATNWDGCKDQVVDGETGFLVPTYMLRDATANATARLLLDEVNYDQFLGECNQAVAVDLDAAAQAFTRLITDGDLRRRMGAAGREVAVKNWAWPHIVRAYEELWQSQEAERQARAAHQSGQRKSYSGPACYPAPEDSFASYPMAILGNNDRLVADPSYAPRLDSLLALAMSNYVANTRSADPTVLRAVLSAAATPTTVGDLDGVLGRSGVPHVAGRATLVWLLKYGLLRVVPKTPAGDGMGS